VENIPYFKIGDTLNIPVQWTDEDTKLGVPITLDTEIKCTILTSYGVRFFPDVIIEPDQVTNAGKFVIKLASTETEKFLACKATLDIRVTINGQVKHSEDFSFYVRRSITVEH